MLSSVHRNARDDMLKPAVSLYGFNSLLESGDITIRAAIRFARSVGFQGFEMLDLYWNPDGKRQTQAEVIGHFSVEEAMPVACYTVHNNLAAFEQAEWQKTVDRMLADVDLAVALGTSKMRVESSSGGISPHQDKSFEECLEPVAKGLKLVARRAAEAGLSVGLENHGRFIGSSERVGRVIDAVGEDNFGACVDIGNFLVVDEDPLTAVTALASRAVHVHVKDMHFFTEDPGGTFSTNAGNFLRGAVFGEGVVDVAGCVKVLMKAGYSDWLSLEFEGRENLFFALAKCAENLSLLMRQLPLQA